MATAASVIAALKSKGKENFRKIYSRHGMAPDRVLGVSTADMKAIAKTIKGRQDVAMELYRSGIMEAMYIAGMVADGAKMRCREINEWAQQAVGLQMICEYTVPWVTVENAAARDLAMEWIGSKNEAIAAIGWVTYGGLVSLRPDKELDLNEIEGLLDKVLREIGGAPNRVRYTMNGFVIAVGSFVKPLAKRAMEAAKKIGAVKVDMGETECKVPLATEYIAKVEAAGKQGQKRKTIRC